MTYNIRTKIEQVSGWQYYSVEAENETEARTKFEAGEADFEKEDLEVTQIGPPIIEKAE